MAEGMVDEELQEAMLNPATQVMFRAGLLACREYMASFVESENPAIAASIRLNWWPSLGADPGAPRRLHWADVYEGEFPDGHAKTKEEVSPSIEALVQAAIFLQHHCGYSWARLGEPDLDSPAAEALSMAKPKYVVRITGPGVDHQTIIDCPEYLVALELLIVRMRREFEEYEAASADASGEAKS